MAATVATVEMVSVSDDSGPVVREPVRVATVAGVTVAEVEMVGAGMELTVATRENWELDDSDGDGTEATPATAVGVTNGLDRGMTEMTVVVATVAGEGRSEIRVEIPPTAAELDTVASTTVAFSTTCTWPETADVVATEAGLAVETIVRDAAPTPETLATVGGVTVASMTTEMLIAGAVDVVATVVVVMEELARTELPATADVVATVGRETIGAMEKLTPPGVTEVNTVSRYTNVSASAV